MILACWAMAVVAQAEEPVTYQDALRGAVERNLGVAAAEAARDQAEGQLMAVRGQYDPLYSLDGRFRQSQSQGFFQGFPFESDSRSWSVNQQVGGSTGTGTDYSVNFNVDRNISEFTNNIGGVGQSTLQDAFTSNLNVAITQQLLRGVLFAYNVQNVTAAHNGLENAQLELGKQRQEVLYQAAEAYWNWAYQEELHQIALDSLAVAEEALRIGKLQVESGQLAPVEATRLEAALVQARQNALDAENLAEQSANAVLLSMGSDPTLEVMPGTDPGDVPALTDLDPVKAAAVALAQNLDLVLAQRNEDQAKIDLANAKHGVLPSLSATLAAGVASQRCPPGTDNQDCTEGNALGAIRGLTANDNQPFVEVSGQFSVPLGNRAARGDRDRLAAVLMQRREELASQRRQITAQVEEQVRALQSARQRMELADANERLARQTLEAEEALASAGRTLQKDVLEARTEVDRTKAEAAKARTDYRLAQALLLKLQGQLTEQTP